jgi:mono/diheme cytochrome c family protein
MGRKTMHKVDAARLTWLGLTLAAAAAAGFFLSQPMRAAVSRGQAEMLYSHKCAICHAGDGSGHTMKGRKYKVKDVREQVKKYTEQQMIEIVEKGKGPNMDSFSDELKPDEIKAVVEYYRSLAETKPN